MKRNAAILIFIILILVSGSVLFLVAQRRHRRFDPERWKSAELYGAGNVRSVMLPDLLKRHYLPRMTKEQVLELLGPQSDPAYFKEWDLRYWLGPEQNPYSGIDSEWLVLRLKDNQVVEYKIVVD